LSGLLWMWWLQKFVLVTDVLFPNHNSFLPRGCLQHVTCFRSCFTKLQAKYFIHVFTKQLHICDCEFCEANFLLNYVLCHHLSDGRHTLITGIITWAFS
jgi:hypothetical protein